MDIDERFSKIHKDPRFKKVPRKLRKVKIDSRFKSMFTDSKFQTKYSVDKRGRPLKQTSSEHLGKFYDLSEDSSSSEDEDNKSTEKKKDKKISKEKMTNIAQKISTKQKNSKAVDDDKDNDELNKNHSDIKVKLPLDAEEVSSSSDGEPDDVEDIRGINPGEHNAESSDEESANEEDEESDDQGLDHDWGELDKDARREENAETQRFAVCNLDWDKVDANDLYVLFNSFVPSGGSIASIKIYPSEYGLERMKEEDVAGPKELKDIIEEKEIDENNQEENVEGNEYHMEKLRQYQLQRFRYYYAVVDCDSVATANRIYEECDNQEFELSATRLDLRFIPDETTFEREPVSMATGGAVLENYKPTDFSSTALHQSRVKLTWDESDPKRMQLMTKAFTKEELEDMDVKAYLASSSSEESDADGIPEEEHSGTNNPDGDDEDARLRKYRSLIEEIEQREKESDDDQDMEISWTPALGESLKTSAKPSDKKEAKGKERNIERLADEDENDENASSELSDADVSNDELQYDSEEEGVTQTTQNKREKIQQVEEKATLSKRGKKKRKKKEVLTEEEKIRQQKNKEELELLLMDDKEEKQHFNLKSIMDKEKKNKKKKLKRKNDEQSETQDNFQLDVHDTRFDALYSSHHFALDPSDSQFRKTNATEAIIKEKHRRKEKSSGPKNRIGETVPTKTTAKAPDPSLSALIKSVKSRTEKHKEAKRQKTGKWRT